jgi:hypothetical protein
VRGTRLDVDKRSWPRMPTTLASVNELRSAPMGIDQESLNEGGCSCAHHATVRADRNRGPQTTRPISTCFMDLNETLELFCVPYWGRASGLQLVNEHD